MFYIGKVGYMSDRKNLIINFFSLLSVQGLNYILPLITLPYLVKVLGPEKFGLVNFSQAFIQYFILFTDYGFNLVATREISMNRTNRERISVIFCSVMIVRIVLMLISIIILIIIVSFIPKFSGDQLLYYTTFGIVIGNVMFPQWFFQGYEKMRIISLLNIGSKFLSTIGIFLFVKNESQYIYVPILNSLGYLLIGCIALFMVFKYYNVSLAFPRKKEIIKQLQEGWDIFLSNIFTSLYTTSNVFILGLLTNNTIVGYFSSAEKLIKAATGLINPLVQTVYPYISKKISESKELSISFLQKIFIYLGLTMLIVSTFIFLSSESIVYTFLGEEYRNSIILLRIMSILPFVLALANVFGILTMINFGYKKQLSRIYIITSCISIITTIILVPLYREVGTAINVVVIESLATYLMIKFLSKNGINLWKKSYVKR